MLCFSYHYGLGTKWGMVGTPGFFRMFLTPGSLAFWLVWVAGRTKLMKLSVCIFVRLEAAAMLNTALPRTGVMLNRKTSLSVSVQEALAMLKATRT